MTSNHETNMNNYPDFKDKVALVTGASSGMGLATAQAFAEGGASVALADVKEEAVRGPRRSWSALATEPSLSLATSATTLR
jgi:NAD(P)-dependent dehydrogenase (short-subunit alcohol dehydrogenase family)